ncbi:toast rack family protein [Cytobacillus sp. FJAT-54145]|uniref:Toast rack family protein n=1 Tax=Cytobacillus spartinae TaxID=3299023 RepID=A0ABW6KJE5_9BACI
MKKMWMLGAAAAGALLVLSGCNVMATEKTEQKSIEVAKDDAEKLEVELNMGAGELIVSKGTGEWLEGEVVYNNDKLEPKVNYDMNGDEGHLIIEQKQKSLSNIKMGDIKNEWDLKLSNDVPIDLTVNAGASNTNLSLKGVQLTSLDVNAGVGDMTVDLTGEWNEGFNVDLKMGVGKTEVLLPKDVGVKIVSKKGIGSAEFKGFISQGDGVYVNDVYEDSDKVITVNTELGVGEVEFKLQ